MEEGGDGLLQTIQTLQEGLALHRQVKEYTPLGRGEKMLAGKCFQLVQFIKK